MTTTTTIPSDPTPPADQARPSDPSTAPGAPPADAVGPPPTEPGPGTTVDLSDAPLPKQLRIEPWCDPVVDSLGHDPRSSYVERFWLPILGPSTTLLLRRLAAELDHEPDGAEVDLATTARALGLGSQGGRRSAFVRALDRSAQFGLAQHLGPARLAVRRRIPPLTQRQVVRLPKAIQDDHADWQARHRPRREPTDRRRARIAALDLAGLGLDVDEVERQLGRWGLHPAVAYDASRWAEERQREAAAAVEPGGEQTHAQTPGAPPPEPA